MKNYLFPILTGIIISLIFGKYLMDEYGKGTTLAIQQTEKLYFVQQGVYSSLTSLEENTTSLEFYSYTILDDKYYCFVGITKNKANLEKITKYYKDKGIEVYAKETSVGNKTFLNVLEQYDNLLSQTDETEMIKTIEKQVLAKYEELIE